MENKKSTGKTALIVLLLIVTIVSLVLATYAWAKYTTTGNGTATAQVAKWNVSFTPDNSKFTGTYTHVVDGKIAPGTSGSFDITVVPDSTEVCFDYTIKIDKVEFLGADDQVLAEDTVLAEGVTLEQLRSHIRFTNEAGDDVTDGTITAGKYDLASHNTKTGASFSAGQTDGKDTFTWTWPYELTDENATAEEKAAYDKIDTAAGLYASSLTDGLKMKVSYTITAVQVDPSK